MEPLHVNLCNDCKELVFKATVSTTLQRQTSPKELLNSSRSCHCCSTLSGIVAPRSSEVRARFNISDKEIDHFPLAISHTAAQNSAGGISSKVVTVTLELPNGFTYPSEMTIAWCLSDCKAVIPPRFQAHELTLLASASASRSPSWQHLPTSHASRLSQIRHWLRRCEQNHPACTPRHPTTLPRRLIDLLPDNDQDSQGEPRAKLVFSKNILEMFPRYTALSYCWGGERKFKATRTTVKAFHQDIPTSELPPTFKEAFETTRQLGIRYIWIDALCIVQDDKLEWEKEVAHMHDVYAGSFLTIQASKARSPSEGCFASTCPDSAKSRGRGRTLFTAQDSSRELEAIIHIVPHGLGTSALNTRGWTLQETVLSHRIIQLTNYELHWRCRSSMLWETGISYVNTERLSGNVPPLQESDDRTWNKLWNTWVENYSEREFSFPDDRLPGMVGLVEAYKRETSDEPCLGLWESSLSEDLAWCRIGTLSDQLAHPPVSQPLPSWSPFVCCQAVEFNRWNRFGLERSAIHYTTEIIDCTIEWLGTPFLSDLLSSKLVVRGPTRKIHLAEATEIPDCNPPYFNINDEITGTGRFPLPWRCAVQWDEECYREPSTWLCLLLQRQTPAGYELSGETFLVLEEVGGESSGCEWRRIGIGSIGRDRSREVSADLGLVFDIDSCQTITLV